MQQISLQISVLPKLALATYWLTICRLVLLIVWRLCRTDLLSCFLLLQEQDTGMYHCEAVNEVGKQRKYFRLKVHVVPTISGPSNTRLEHSRSHF